MKIHIDWSGPFTLDSIKALQGPSDYGVYQVYGTHPVYGSDVLLYIGLADETKFSTRVPQHEKFTYQNCTSVRIYVGKLSGQQGVTKMRWSREIKASEALLIYSHKPAFNSTNIEGLKLGKDVHVYNWGEYQSLLPEVSSFRVLANDKEKDFEGIALYSEDEV